MTDLLRPSRRGLGRLIASGAFSVLASRGGAAVRGPKDQGIGGTGRPSGAFEPDQGLGGTGVVGTIEGFGSVIVNGLEVSYARNVNVLIDGRPSRNEALRVGHVVRLVAERGPDGLKTMAIEATSEVTGPVGQVSVTHLRVMGQWVRIAGRNAETDLAPGQWVAVHGLRQLDGSIVASRIDRVAPGAARLAGPLDRTASGVTSIGGLVVRGAPEAPVGRRVILEGRYTEGVLQVEHAFAEAAQLGDLSRRLLIEAYVRRRGETVAFGSGFVFEARTSLADELSDEETRALVALSFDVERGFVIDRVWPHDIPRRSGSGAGIGVAAGPGPGFGPGAGLGEGMGPSAPPVSSPGFGFGAGGHRGGHR